MIYIAGPLTNSDPKTQAANIDRAQRAYYALLEVGLTGICPHLSGTDPRAFEVPYDLWIKNGLRQLDACEAIWLLPGWNLSNGALLELAQACRLRKVKQQQAFTRFERLCLFYGRNPASQWWNDAAEYTTCLSA